jgi:transposase
MASRRKYTREFKLAAVKMVNHDGYTVVEAAKSLGIDPQNVRNWVEELSAEVGKAPTDEPAQLREELRRLRQENKRLLMEREILKKAAAYFARQSN